MNKTKEQLAEEANGYLVFAKETKAPIFNEGFLAGFEAAEPKWISVDDQLPDFNQDVIVSGYQKSPTMDGKMIISIQRRIPYSHLPNRHIVRDIIEPFNGFRSNVKFWMPLPQSPNND